MYAWICSTLQSGRSRCGQDSYTHLIEGPCTLRITMFSQVRHPTVVARGNDNALSAPRGKESPVITISGNGLGIDDRGPRGLSGP